MVVMNRAHQSRTHTLEGDGTMTTWVTPEFVEIDMSAEIGAYQEELVPMHPEEDAAKPVDEDAPRT